jgi:hypothetical protein
MKPKVVIHNHYAKPVRDHFYNHTGTDLNGFELLEGAGTDGGRWAVRSKRNKAKVKMFNSRKEAESWANNQPHGGEVNAHASR